MARKSTKTVKPIETPIANASTKVDLKLDTKHKKSIPVDSPSNWEAERPARIFALIARVRALPEWTVDFDGEDFVIKADLEAKKEIFVTDSATQPDDVDVSFTVLAQERQVQEAELQVSMHEAYYADYRANIKDAQQAWDSLTEAQRRRLNVGPYPEL